MPQFSGHKLARGVGQFLDSVDKPMDIFISHLNATAECVGFR